MKKFPSVKSVKGVSAINQTTCALVSDGGLSPPWRSRVAASLVPIEQSSTDAIWDIKRSGHSSVQPCGQANIQGVPEHSSSSGRDTAAGWLDEGGMHVLAQAPQELNERTTARYWRLPTALAP